MAKPRVFISSTYYDLKQTRADIANFISSLGFEPVRNEEGEIPYGREDKLQNYCYKEIQNIDILISIIGGRFGSEAQNSHWSVSNEELKTAIKNGKQVYIFIEKNVSSEYETYLLNKGTEIKYKYVDDIRIYQFIEDIKSISSNNNIKAFDTSADIQMYLKEQLAGLFQSFLSAQVDAKNYSLATQLENTAKTLSQLVEYLKEANSGKEDGINKLLKMNHPLVHFLSDNLMIKFGFWIDTISDLNALLCSMSWKTTEEKDADSNNYYSWEKDDIGGKIRLRIDSTLFGGEKNLLPMNNSQWQDSYVKIEKVSLFTDQVSELNDLPF